MITAAEQREKKMLKPKAKLDEINRLIERLLYRMDRYSVLSDVFEIAAITVSNRFDRRSTVYEARENRYKEIIRKYDEDERDVIVKVFTEIYLLLTGMVDRGFDDYLGKLYMMSGTSNSVAGQFFTPYDVSCMCAEVAVDEESLRRSMESNEIITLNEPTCGSGGMILAAVEALHRRGFNYSNNLLVKCGDVDSRCVYMAYLQLSLAAIPAVILHQNALTLETWETWHTPALCLNWMRFVDKV